MSQNEFGYRADIDGLRAVAIVLVLFFHAFPEWIPGGYIGVDVFFVISGYLISSIILLKLNSEKFSVMDFYVRRIRRIFPALFIVLFTILAAGWFMLFSNEYTMVGKHIAASTAFIQNIILREEAGYFDITGEKKPLLHLWSLGLEEQFYFFWPLILILFHKSGRKKLLPTIVLILVSFVSCYLKTPVRPEKAFYSLSYRCWELLAGGILAIYFPRIGKRSSHIYSFIGLGLILIPAFIFDNKSLFPGWRALLPVSGAFLIILAGQAAHLNRLLLSNKGMVAVGLISYPLYLWHWPLLSFARIVYSEVPPVTVRLFLVFVSVILAWLTYKAIEIPLRKLNSKLAVISLTTAMVLIGASGFIVFKNNGFPDRVTKQNIKEPQDYDRINQANDFCKDSVLSQFDSDIRKNVDFCHSEKDPKNADVLVIGDSHANRLYVGLKEADTSRHYLNVGRSTCMPFYGVDASTKSGIKLKCLPAFDRILDYAIDPASPKTILILAYYARYFEGQFNLSLSQEEFAKRIDLTFQKLSASDKKIVFIWDAPSLPMDPELCQPRLWRPFKEVSSRCEFPLEKHLSSSAYTSTIKEILRKYPDIKQFDPSEVLCHSGKCFGASESLIFYTDQHHLNSDGAKMVATELIKIL